MSHSHGFLEIFHGNQFLVLPGTHARHAACHGDMSVNFYYVSLATSRDISICGSIVDLNGLVATPRNRCPISRITTLTLECLSCNSPVFPDEIAPQYLDQTHHAYLAFPGTKHLDKSQWEVTEELFECSKVRRCVILEDLPITRLFRVLLD